MERSQPDSLANRETAADLRATVAARRELGPDLEDPVIEAFLARLEGQINARVDQQLQLRGADRPQKAAKQQRSPAEVVAPSLALSIPLIAIAGGISGGVGVVAVMVTVMLINLVYFIDRWNS